MSDQVHRPRMWTWADPDDGHSYYANPGHQEVSKRLRERADRISGEGSS